MVFDGFQSAAKRQMFTDGGRVLRKAAFLVARKKFEGCVRDAHNVIAIANMENIRDRLEILCEALSGHKRTRTQYENGDVGHLADILQTIDELENTIPLADADGGIALERCGLHTWYSSVRLLNDHPLRTPQNYHCVISIEALEIPSEPQALGLVPSEGYEGFIKYVEATGYLRRWRRHYMQKSATARRGGIPCASVMTMERGEEHNDSHHPPIVHLYVDYVAHELMKQAGCEGFQLEQRFDPAGSAAHGAIRLDLFTFEHVGWNQVLQALSKVAQLCGKKNEKCHAEIVCLGQSGKVSRVLNDILHDGLRGRARHDNRSEVYAEMMAIPHQPGKHPYQWACELYHPFHVELSLPDLDKYYAPIEDDGPSSEEDSGEEEEE